LYEGTFEQDRIRCTPFLNSTRRLRRKERPRFIKAGSIAKTATHYSNRIQNKERPKHADMVYNDCQTPGSQPCHRKNLKPPSSPQPHYKRLPTASIGASHPPLSPPTTIINIPPHFDKNLTKKITSLHLPSPLAPKFPIRSLTWKF
jgi:hypothetical protein